MNRLAEDVYQLGGFPPYAFNIYLVGDVLIDAGSRLAARRILRQLRGRRLTAHALTHAHPDHQGASHAVCQALGVPLWCGSGDAEAAEDPRVMLARMPVHPINRWIAPRLAGPGHPVARRLVQGDEVAGFTVIETPGHTAGHLSFWRASDRVLVIGDVMANMSLVTGRAQLREPPWYFSADPAANRAAARSLARLEPALIAFGHGPPLRDTGRFLRFVERLPR